jgi:hypothetical protein
VIQGDEDDGQEANEEDNPEWGINHRWRALRKCTRHASAQSE